MRKLTIFISAMLLCACMANASIIYNLTGTAAVVGGTQFTYNAVLSPDQKIDSTVGPNFGVLYDFQGYVAGSLSCTNVAAGLTVSCLTENTTSPQPTLQNAPDNASIPNLRSNITGSLSVATATTIYTVMAVSSLTQTQLGYQSAEAVKNAPGDLSNNTLSGNTVRIEIPQNAVPEPATYFMLGGSLVGLACIRRRRVS